MCRVSDFVHRKRCIAERFRKACRCCVRRPEFLILQAQGERSGCRRSMSRKNTVRSLHAQSIHQRGKHPRVRGKIKECSPQPSGRHPETSKVPFVLRRPQLFKIITVGNAFGGFDYIRSAVTCTDLLQFIFGKCGNAFRSRKSKNFAA